MSASFFRPELAKIHPRIWGNDPVVAELWAACADSSPHMGEQEMPPHIDRAEPGFIPA